LSSIGLVKATQSFWHKISFVFAQ